MTYLTCRYGVRLLRRHLDREALRSLKPHVIVRCGHCPRPPDPASARRTATMIKVRIRDQRVSPAALVKNPGWRLAGEYRQILTIPRGDDNL
jgi:hypothetical protein